MEGERGSSSSSNRKKKKDRCLTMHQPWASLLVHGIKRIEGRSWPAPLTGRLWIHAASKVPDDATIRTMEEFYREIYALDGITGLMFPQHYPVSRLVGCIEVVGCLRREELACWKEVPEGVRLEALTDFCWLCEQPQKLSVPLEMRGWHGVYDLDDKVYKAAMENIVPVESPSSVKFPLPNPRDPFSLKPGSIPSCSLEPEVEKSPKLLAVIDGASRAATQFSNKSQSFKNDNFDGRNGRNFIRSKVMRPVKEDQYNQDYGFGSRNQKYNTRPDVRQFVRKEQEVGKRNDMHFYRPVNMQFVKKEEIDKRNPMANGFNKQCRLEGNDC